MNTTPVRRRTRARELALQFLYAFEMRGEEAMSELDAFVDHHTKTGENAADDQVPSKDRLEIADYSRELVHGVHDHLEDLNRWIEHIARNWRLDRMAYLDRNILRIALYELLHQTEIPFKVVINEAIDIAKRFSTAQSGSFVNGILDRARVLIDDARAAADGTVPLAPEAGQEGKGAAAESSMRAVATPSSNELPGGTPVPRPGRRSQPPAERGPAPADAAEDAMPEAGEFPTAGDFPSQGESAEPGEDLADPAALPRPRRRRRRRRENTDS